MSSEVHVDGRSLVPFDKSLADPSNPAYGGGPVARQQGVFALPHVLSFSSLMNLSTQAYSWRWDEAMKTSRTDALAMRRDPFVMGILQERKLACSQLNWHIEPEEPKDKRQKACAEYITKIIERIPNFPNFRYCMQEAVWFGRYGIHEALSWKEQSTRPPEIPGPEKALQITAWRPVNGDKIQNRYRLATDSDNKADLSIHLANSPKNGVGGEGDRVIEDGTPIILINAAYAQTIPNSETVLTDRGWALLLRTPYWRERFVLHKHEIDDADFFEAEMAGGVHGVGIRSRIYWMWWLKQEFLGNVVDFIQRVGQGTVVFFYEAGNPASEAQAIKAANEMSTNTVIVWPRPIGSEKQGAGIERFDMPLSGSEMLIKLQEYMDRIIERYMIGQSMSSGADNESGLGGSGRANFAADTKYRITKFDAANADSTLTTDLVKPLQRWNCPEEKYHLRFVSDVDKPNSKDQLDAANKAYSMGASIKEDEVLEYAGLSKPAPDDKVLKQPQPGGATGAPGMGGMPGAGDQGLAEGPLGGGEQLPGAMDAAAEGGSPGEGGAPGAGEPSDGEIDKLLAELMPEGAGDATEGETEPAEQMARRAQARRYVAAFARRFAVQYGKNPSAEVKAVGAKLAKSGKAMPGYGQIFIKENGSGEAWYVGGDGDEDGFAKMVKAELMKVDGIDEVTYEAEGFPPKDQGWMRVYPSQKRWRRTVADDAAAQYAREDPAKKTIRWKGLSIAIENPAGSVRKWTNRHGQSGEQVIKNDYGYVKGSDGADGDAVDVFMGPDLDSETVYVINQIEPKSGAFDEHKVVLGAGSEKQAKDIYLGNYQPGWKGLGDIIEIPLEAFKEWLESGETTEAIEDDDWAGTGHGQGPREDTVTYARRWVKSEADVPEGATPIKGPKGGIYYETGKSGAGKAKPRGDKPKAGAAKGRAELVKALEAKGFHGTLDRLKRGLITEDQAHEELTVPLRERAERNPVDIPARPGPNNAAEHAAEMKAAGIDRAESWSRWVQKTSLNPGMDAKDWFKIYDSVTAKAAPAGAGLQKVAAAMGVDGAEGMDKAALTKAIVGKAKSADEPKPFDPYLRQLRERAGISLTQLAVKTGIAEPKLREFEAGTKKPNTMERRSIEANLTAPRWTQKTFDSKMAELASGPVSKPPNPLAESLQNLAAEVKAGKAGYMDTVRALGKITKLSGKEAKDLAKSLGIENGIDGKPIVTKDDVLKAAHRWIMGPGKYHSKELSAAGV